MQSMQSLYNALAVPFGWILHFFYNISGNYLLSLFILVLIVKLILLPQLIALAASAAVWRIFAGRVASGSRSGRSARQSCSAPA